MRRKLFVIATSLCLMLSMLFPANVFAEEEPAEEGFVQKAFFANDLTQAYDAGKLTMPEEWADVTVSKEPTSGGLMIKGPKAQIASGKIKFTDDFDFSEGKVGRITFCGLGDRKLKIVAEVYLDDQEEPVAQIPLRHQKGKKGWAVQSDVTVNAAELGITGKHQVSLRLVDQSDTEDTKEISIMIHSIEFAQITLPVIWFDLDETEGTISAMNSSEDHSEECYGNVTFQVPKDYQCEYTDKPLSDQTLELEYIRGRGNSTWWADKKPYKFKLDKSTDLFGMGKNKHWVLLANRYDPSFMRNKMTYWLGDQLGMEFTPQSIPVEVVMNGEYYGCYFLTEQIRVGKSRVNVDDLEEGTGPDATEEPEITGGYLLSMEPSEEENGWLTKKKNAFYLEHPSYEEYKNQAQVDYIKKYVQDTENAIFGKDFKDENDKSYEDYLDVPSAVDYFWVQNFSLNGDAFLSGSTYLYKKREGKLFWGPLWDFDFVAWGDLEYGEYNTTGFLEFGMNWFTRLLGDPSFSSKVTARWPELKQKLEEVTQQGGLLDQYYDQLKVAAAYDEEKYGMYEEERGGYDYSGYNDLKDIQEALDEEKEEASTRTYKDQVEQLRGWIEERVKWVDENLDDLKSEPIQVRFLLDGKVVETRTVLPNEEIGDLPEVPEKKGYIFQGWYIYDDERLTDDSTITDSVDAVAVYVKQDKAVKAKNLYLSTYNIVQPLYMEEAFIGYTVMPRNAYNADVEWSSSNTDIAEVESGGNVFFKKPGTVEITASIKDGPKATCKVTILSMDSEQNYPEGFELSKKSLTLKKGDYTQLVATPIPEDAVDFYIAWACSDDKVIDIDEFGIVTAKKAGKAQIFAIDPTNYTVQAINVTVTDPAAVKAAKAKTVKGLKVKVKGRKAIVTFKKTKGAAAYQVQYKLKNAKKWKYLKKSLKKTKVKTKKLKKGKKYSFRVRTITKVNGKNVYGKWTKAKSIKIK